ncbi:MAG: hypothetical protein EOO88_15520 [Pedobacter sp.]|nr:MAG: hypothetical protein EOO88_15520 [Pedobacter sp.]
MKITYKIFFCLAFSILTLSCKKWIDVKPTDRLGEDQLFVDPAGYTKAINGVYVEMANTALYGQEMTTGAVDVMAQYYVLTSSTHRYFETATFVYSGTKMKTLFDDAWKKSFELIANCNVIIEKCGDGPSQKLPEPYYGVIKGEALALRAFFHLDMLRLFGPIYSDENKAKPAIPYVTKSGFEVSPILSAEEVIKHITDDLKAALALLENTDPIRTSGVRNGNNPAGPNDLYYRQYRLNYYAAKALLARAYLWQGDKASALTEAEALLTEVQGPKNVFPYVTVTAALGFTQGNTVIPADRLFTTEVMFGVYDIKRSEMFDRQFHVGLDNNTKLSFSNGDSNESRVNALYDDANDYRRRIWQNASSGTVTALTNLKYLDQNNVPGRYMIPLVRLSEVLLIAAESHPDLATGITYLNKVRTSRNS